MKKTKCCELEYIGDNHNPVRDNGYCMNCGYHPAQEKLEKCKDALKEVANGHLHEKVSEAIARQTLKELEEV